MFDIWQKIDEKGALAVPTKSAALSALGWAEIAEVYPELVSEEYRHWDVYADPQLICESPFTEFGKGSGRTFKFRATDCRSDKKLETAVDADVLVDVLGQKDFTTIP